MADPRIAAVRTTGRQDHGILRSTLLCLRNDPSFELRLLVGGMHLSLRYGLRQALTPQFRKRCESSMASAGKGKTGQAIVALLRQWRAPHPPRKHFCDLQLQCARN